jgi:hypothetical protein
MNDPVTERVRRMLAAKEPPSRNRDFETYAGPEGGRVWRAYKLYRSLLADIRRVGKGGVRVRTIGDAGGAVEVRGLPGKARRTTWVPAVILSVLARRVPFLRTARDREAGSR